MVMMWMFLVLKVTGLIAGKTYLITVIHEAGHALTAVSCGHKLEGCGVNLTGPYIRHSHPTPSWRNRMLITVAGPAANFLAAMAGLGFGWREFALLNAVFGLVNLVVPNANADGARMANAYREWRKEQVKVS